GSQSKWGRVAVCARSGFEPSAGTAFGSVLSTKRCSNTPRAAASDPVALHFDREPKYHFSGPGCSFWPGCLSRPVSGTWQDGSWGLSGGNAGNCETCHSSRGHRYHNPHAGSFHPGLGHALRLQIHTSGETVSLVGFLFRS